MKRPGTKQTVGSYLVWRRGPVAVRIALVLGAVVLLGKGAASAITDGAVHYLVGVGVLAVVAGVVAWLALRDARTPMRAIVSPEGLVLEPVRRGEPYRCTWRELSIRRYWDEDGDTLELTAPRTGTLLLADGDGPVLDTLVNAIRAHGAEVREKLS